MSFFVSSFSVTLCVGIYVVDKTVTSLSLKGTVSSGDETYSSTLPKLSVASQTFVIIQAAFFALSGS